MASFIVWGGIFAMPVKMGGEVADILRDIVKTTEAPKRLRMFFTSCITGISVDADSVVINYDK